MIPVMTESAGWSEYQLLVLAELKRHNAVIEHLAQQISEIKIDLAVFERTETRLAELERRMGASDVNLAMLNVKAGLWGGVSGLLVAVATAILYALQN